MKGRDVATKHFLNFLPSDGLTMRMEVVDGVLQPDTIGLSISELYPLVDPALRSIISADGGSTMRDAAEIVTLALAHADLNRSTMGGSEAEGIFFYNYLTTPVVAPATTLTKACRYMGVIYTPPTGPNAFSFTDATGAELETVVESNAITVAGISVAVPFTVTGGTAQLNGAGTWVASGMVSVNDTVKVGRTSSDQYETAVDVVLNINDVSDTFSVTTRSQSDILAARILASGYQAEIDLTDMVVGGTPDFGLGLNNDPTNAKIAFTVTSQGYNDSCVLGTIQRTVYATIVQRQPYPNQAQKEESVTGGVLTVRVDLSDFIHPSDTVSATVSSGFYTDNGAGGSSRACIGRSGLAVTNNSTVNYPVPIANWTCLDRDIVGNSLKVSALAFQAYGQQKRPVRAVKFIATDESANSVSAIVTAMAIDPAMSADSIPFPEFYTTLDITSLTDDQEITVQMEVYPWVGNADAIAKSSTTGYTEFNWRLRPLKYFKDANLSHGYAVVVVDSVSGNDTTGAAAANLATADTTPCLSMFRAIRRLYDFNNANYSRANCSGGTVYLKAGSHNALGGNVFTPVTGVFKAPLKIRPYPGLTKADVTIVPAGAAADKTLTSIITRFIDLTFSRSSDTYWLFGATGRRVQFENCSFADTRGTGTYATTVSTFDKFDFSQCSIDDVAEDAGLLRGCLINRSFRKPYLTVFSGNKFTNKISWIFSESTLTTNTIEGGILAFNEAKSLVDPVGYGLQLAHSYTQGLAIVGNIFEMLDTASEPALAISADGTTSSTQHVIIWNNTILGQRENLAYNDTGTTNTPHVNWSVKFNQLDYFANKNDLFTNSGNTIGGWPVAFGVGTHGNVVGDAAFEQEFVGLYSVGNVSRDAAGFQVVDYKAGAAGVGGGDYHLTAPSPARNRVPAGQAVIPFGLDGVVIADDGTGSAGCYQYVP